MIVVVALGALLVAIVVFAFIRLRSLDQRAAALEAERARLAADGEALRRLVWVGLEAAEPRVATSVATAEEFTRCRVPEEDRDGLFTVGRFSVADALLDASMEEVLETLPFSEESSGALLRREGPLGEMLAIVLRYEQGHVPASGASTALAEANLAALKWADRAGWWVD